jgi:plasmid replication initiation protein
MKEENYRQIVMNTKDLIVKSNQLIQARIDLSANQLKFLAFAISKIGSNQTSFFGEEVKADELFKVLNIPRKNHQRLYKSLESLIDKIIVIDNKYEHTVFAFLSYFKHDKKTDLIAYDFAKPMEEFLLQLKNNFTQLSLKKFCSFNSSFTIRFYELLQSQIGLANSVKAKKFKIDYYNFYYSLDGLKLLLLNDNNKHILFANFKIKVLEVARKELNEKNDFSFAYEVKKQGKKVIGLHFKIIYSLKK